MLEDSGNYTCIARTSAELKSHTAILVINTPPKWLIEPRDIIINENQDHVTLDCVAIGFPSPVTKWKSINDEGELVLLH